MFDLGARRWWAVGALVLAVLAVGFDVTILSLALPALATGLKATTSELQWFVAAYTLVFAAAMIPSGMLGDRFGRRRRRVAARRGFGAGSAGAAYAPSAGVFIAARAVLGLGGAAIMPMVLGLLTVLFAEEERRRAISIVMGATLLGYPIGPILGGWLLGHFWWGSVFLINVPVVVIALVAVVAWLPESRGSQTGRLDLTGIVTSSTGLTAVTYGVIHAGRYGWGDTTTLASLAAGVALLVTFLAWERRAERPLMDPALFGRAGFSVGTALGTAVNFVMFGVLFAVPQYFQAVLGADAMASGVRLLPLIGGMLVGAVVADRLGKQVGAGIVAAAGSVLLAAGLFTGATTAVGDGFGPVAAWTALCGAGLGFVMPIAMDAALGTLPEGESGVGSAVIQAIRMVGGSFGAAILGSVLNTGYRGRLDLTSLPTSAASAVRDGVFGGLEVARSTGSAALAGSVRAAFTHGMDQMLVVCGGMAALVAVIALVYLPRGVTQVGVARTERSESEHEPAS
jgi:DHA2 family multidrug resistance protein-like MFS transporter